MTWVRIRYYCSCGEALSATFSERHAERARGLLAMWTLLHKRHRPTDAQGAATARYRAERAHLN